jgi:D-alanyl-D-alanine carboxypeptidase
VRRRSGVSLRSRRWYPVGMSETSEPATWKGLIVALAMAGAMLPLALATRFVTRVEPVTVKPAPKVPQTFDVGEIDRYLSDIVTTDGYVGLSVAIARDGKIVLAKGYGTTARKAGAPVGTETAFAIGSVTKQFTCAGAYLLEEDGKLQMTDRVAKYFPDLARANDITLDDLGAHVSGYTDYYPLDFYDRRMQQGIEPDDLVKRYTSKLDFEPHARYSYSNTGFVLLGRILEKASAQPLTALLERVWKRAGMEQASLEPKDDPAHLATGHRAFAFEDPTPVPREPPHWLWAAGAMYASATDLAKWDVALTGGELLSPASYRAMTTPRMLTTGRSTSYGCGLIVSPRSGETVFEHGGAVSGFLAANIVIPRTRSAIVVLSNSEGGSPSTVANAIATLLLKEHRAPPPKVEGAKAEDVAREMFRAMQEGKVDRTRLAPEFDAFLTDDLLAGAAKRLEKMGAPASIEIERQGMRGGIEASAVKITFASAPPLQASMYRSLDGKVEQFLLSKP